MNFFKTTTILLALMATANFAHAQSQAQSQAQAQSTPVHDHDHSTHDVTSKDPTTVMDGTYAEVEGDHVLGSPTAPISMIIYASVTCPHCATWFNSVWPDIKTNYVETNKLRVVFREFPTGPVDIAVIGFQIANCAPEDQYMGMIEHLMTEQENIFTSLNAGTGKATFLEIAEKAGLADEAAMNTCIQSDAGYDRLDKSIALANSADINSVPNFIINGKLITQGSNYLPLSKHFNKLLAQGYSPMLKP